MSTFFTIFLVSSTFVPDAHPAFASDTLASGSLTVTVVDARTLTPVVGASVAISGSRTAGTTDRAGIFRLRLPADGRFTLRVEAVGYRTSETLVTSPLDSIRISMVPEVFHLDEVVATASPVAGAALYQPARAYAGEELYRRSAASFGEMLDGEPGLAMRSFGPAPGRPVIRGLDGDRVLLLENGERMGDLAETAADHAISVDPLSAQRVEVVRGPASLLYGSSALGGVINVMSGDIPQRWAPGATFGLAGQGASASRSSTASGTATVGGERWATTGRIAYSGAGNLSTPEGRLPGTFSERVTGAGGFGFMGERFSGGASLGLVDHRYGLPDGIDDPNSEVQIGMERQNVQARAHWQPGDAGDFLQGIEFRMNASRYRHEEIERTGLETRRPMAAVDLDFLQHALSSTVTLSHGPLGFLEHGALGFNTLIRDLQVSGEEGLTPNGRSDFFATFLYEEIPITPRLRLQTGARIELQRMRGSANAHFPDFDDRRETATYSGSIGLNARPLDGFEVGFQVARAHRAPMIEELYSDAAHLGTGAYEIGDPALGNEIGRGFDLFARHTSERIRVELAGFHNAVSSYVILSPTGEVHAPSGFPVLRYEADDAELWGGELSLEAAVTARLKLQLGADYVRGTRTGQIREPLPFIPPPRSTIGVTYDRAAWWTGATTRLVGGQNRVATEEDPSPGYALLRLEAGYRHLSSGRHLVLLRVDNALDSVYRDHLSRLENRGFPMPGRNINVIYRWSF